jgi:hypothetical protein
VLNAARDRERGGGNIRQCTFTFSTASRTTCLYDAADLAACKPEATRRALSQQRVFAERDDTCGSRIVHVHVATASRVFYPLTCILPLR